VAAIGADIDITHARFVHFKGHLVLDTLIGNAPQLGFARSCRSGQQAAVPVKGEFRNE
jgi:hypothetical protein